MPLLLGRRWRRWAQKVDEEVVVDNKMCSSVGEQQGGLEVSQVESAPLSLHGLRGPCLGSGDPDYQWAGSGAARRLCFDRDVRAALHP